MGWRKLLLVDLALLAIMILASRAALVLHEVAGHAQVARAVGADRVSIRMSAFGGGYVQWKYPPSKRVSPFRKASVQLSGIAINLATGAAAWFAARRLRRKGFLYLGLFAFGFGSVAGGLMYLSNGFYYGSGDPAGFAPVTQDIRAWQWLWIPIVPCAGAAAWLGARHSLDFLAGQAPLARPRSRIGWMLATVGLAGAAYGGLWLGFRDPGIEGSTRQWRWEQEIVREEKKRAAERVVVRPLPPGTPGTQDLPPPRPAAVRPEEVKDRVPAPVGPVVLYSTVALAMFVSLALAPPPEGGAELRLWPAPVLALAAAFVALAFLALGSPAT